MAENSLELFTNVFETWSENRAHGSWIVHILSVVSVDVSEIGRGLVLQSGDWSTGTAGHVGKSGI